MSPTEDQLRASLRDGEGGAPDPDAIIGRALRVRHQRRTRIAAVAAVVVVVGGLGVGLAAWNRAGGGGNQASGGAETGSAASSNHIALNGPVASAAVPTPGSTFAYGDANVDVPKASNAACPSTAVRYSLPGGGGTDQFGASGSLFSGPVASILVCNYDPAVTGKLISTDTVDGAAAADTAKQLDGSTLKGTTLLCLTPLSMELIPADADGSAMTALSVVGTCDQAIVTNGTAVRYVPITVFGLASAASASNGVQSGGAANSGGSPPR